MKYCLVCYELKEPAKSAPRKYCLKCSVLVRKAQEAKRKRLQYKGEIKKKRQLVALTWYYKNKEKVLENKKVYYKQRRLKKLFL